MTSQPLTGQTAIVTGGGRGFGREIARALAKEGVKVAVVARSADQLAETVSLIQSEGGQAIAITADVTDPSAVCAMVEQVERELMTAIPERHWSEAHHLLIWHGRRLCKRAEK